MLVRRNDHKLGEAPTRLSWLILQWARYLKAVIDLQVREESGQIVVHTRGFEWTQELIDLDCSAYPMLTGLCAYLDTVFNQRQIPMLLAELERLPAGLIPESASAEIRRLARIVEKGQHLYLWFCGD
jgi:hypothetical protein